MRQHFKVKLQFNMVAVLLKYKELFQFYPRDGRKFSSLFSNKFRHRKRTKHLMPNICLGS